MTRASAWASWWARTTQPVNVPPASVKPVDAPPGDPADEMVISEPLRIRQLIGELTRTGRLLSLQTPDGVVARSRTLQTDAAGRLTLRLLPPDSGRLFDAAPASVNVTASAETGLLLFTLGPLTPQAPGCLSCDWPQQLIQVQSRRHFRARVLTGSQHRATLSLPGAPSALRLQDLSEAGVGLVLDGAGVAPGSRYAGATLSLGREAITVPWVQVVQCRPCAGEDRWAVGAQLMGLAAEDTRRLRRFMATAQAAMPRPVTLAQA